LDVWFFLKKLLIVTPVRIRELLLKLFGKYLALHVCVSLQVRRKENFHPRRRKQVKTKEGKAVKSKTISIPRFENL